MLVQAGNMRACHSLALAAVFVACAAARISCSWGLGTSLTSHVSAEIYVMFEPVGYQTTYSMHMDVPNSIRIQPAKRYR